MIDSISAYLAKIDRIYQSGNATEHTFRPALKTLVETFEPSIIDELADFLQVANIKLSMKDFCKATQTEDATIHFYEDFLSAHNPGLRKSRGVFYTPQPAVNYIVRAVDEILQREFNLRDGIADNVLFLDPATGPGTFFAEVIRQVYTHIAAEYGQETWNDYAVNHLLPRLHGFEVLPIPYLIAQSLLAALLQETGCRLEKNQRFNIHLANALKTEKMDTICQDTVTVVLGNPPYNVSTMNRGEFSIPLLAKYKEGLKEKKTNLDDDYIKFIALGQNFIEKKPNGCGILAYISNNSFLDGITHRQMRKVLLETFDKIYILNLHGNARKKEKTPDGGKDENVFNIMQGNSINIFIRSPSKKEGTLGNVFYVELYGKRQEKFDFLLKRRLKKTGYERLEPVEPYYFFVSKDFSLQKKYDSGFSLSELFVEYNSGIKTDRDDLFIDFDRDILAERIKQLLSGDYDWRFEDKFRIVDSSGYKLTRVIKNKKYGSKYLQRIAYRPFDNRWIYYDPTIISRPGYKAMQHLLDKDNFCLIVSRQVKLETWNHVYLANNIVECCVNFCGAGMPKIFPLYVYPPQEERRANFNQEIVTKIEQNIGKKVKPEKMFDYIYAVLHSPKYRKEYEEFLKIDFPRIPYPSDNTEFERFAKVGQRLCELHLLEKIPKFKTTFPVADGNVVENIRYSPPVEGAGGGRVFINKAQYFGNVPETAWTFFVGGYQPAQKWLKDRKGRELSFEDIQHYQKIVCVLNETIEMMDTINAF